MCTALISDHLGTVIPADKIGAAIKLGPSGQMSNDQVYVLSRWERNATLAHVDKH